MSDIESLLFNARYYNFSFTEEEYNLYRRNSNTTTSNKIHNYLNNGKKPIYLPPLQIPKNEEKTNILFEVFNISRFYNLSDVNTIASTFMIGETEYIFPENVQTIRNNEYGRGITVDNNNLQNIEKVNKLFEVIYPEKLPLFPEVKPESEENIFMNKKRNRSEEDSEYSEGRKYDEDNVRRKIVRDFFNSSFWKLINNRLTKANSIIKLDKFSKDFIRVVALKHSHKALNMTLREIFKCKEFNKKENKIIRILELPKYKEIREATELDEILNRTFSDVFKEYLSSEEFIKNVNLLREKENNDDYYVEKYINYSKLFIENYI